MDEKRIGQKHDWTKSFGPKAVGRKGVGRKVGARYIYDTLVICMIMLTRSSERIFNPSSYTGTNLLIDINLLIVNFNSINSHLTQ